MDENNGYPIRPGLWIPEREVWFEFAHAGGPGGQNVNKVATAATVNFHVASAGTLSGREKAVILSRLANRINADGVLRVTASDARTQSANRRAAAVRFCALLADVLTPVKKRRPTAPTRSSIERRLTDKRFRAARKSGRARPDADPSGE